MCWQWCFTPIHELGHSRRHSDLSLSWGTQTCLDTKAGCWPKPNPGKTYVCPTKPLPPKARLAASPAFHGSLSARAFLSGATPAALSDAGFFKRHASAPASSSWVHAARITRLVLVTRMHVTHHSPTGAGLKRESRGGIDAECDFGNVGHGKVTNLPWAQIFISQIGIVAVTVILHDLILSTIGSRPDSPLFSASNIF